MYLHRRMHPDAGSKAKVRPPIDWVVPYPRSQHHPPRPFKFLCQNTRNLYCSCRGNVLTPVLPTLAMSASTNTSKANIHTNVKIAGPGCTESARDWQVPHFTMICGFVSGARHLPLLPQRRNPPSPFFHHPS